MEDSFPVLGPSSGQRPPPAVPYSASPTAPLRRDNGPRFTVHETTKQLTDDLTTTSIRQPQLPAVSWIRMPPIRIYCASQPSARMPRARITRATIPRATIPRARIPRARIPRAKIPRAKIPRANMPRTRVHCADQPPHRPRPIAPPASKRPSPTRKKNQTTPISPNPFPNQQLASPGSPKTRSANLGFEIRGFSHPSEPLIPSPQQTTNPPRPPTLPACRQVPTPSQTAKIELPNRPNS